MKIERIIVLEGNKHYTGFLPGQGKFTPYLQFTIHSLTCNLNDPEFKLTGFIDFHYVFKNIPERRRIHFTHQNFIDNSYNYNLASGDLLNCVRIGLHYNLPVGSLFEVGLLRTDYLQVTQRAGKSLNNPIDILEYIRTLSPAKFLESLTADLHALEAPSVKGSIEHFKKWVYVDRILRLYGAGEIDKWYLDWAAQFLHHEYEEVKEVLGIAEIVV